MNTVTVSEHNLRELRAVCQRHEAKLHVLIGQAVGDGARTQDIADAMGISRATLWRHYAGVLRRDGPEVRPASR